MEDLLKWNKKFCCKDGFFWKSIIVVVIIVGVIFVVVEMGCVDCEYCVQVNC